MQPMYVYARHTIEGKSSEAIMNLRISRIARNKSIENNAKSVRINVNVWQCSEL